MPIGAMTRQAAESVQSDDALFFDFVTFVGDSSYPTGGTTGFDATLQALVGDERDVIAVIPQDCGGYLPVYVRGTLNGLLKVYQNAAINTPHAEVSAATNLSAVTFNLMVISK